MSGKYDRGIIRTIPGVGILDAWGTGVPTAGASGYATGCTYKRIDGGADTALYINEGSNTSATWVAITS